MLLAYFCERREGDDPQFFLIREPFPRPPCETQAIPPLPNMECRPWLNTTWLYTTIWSALRTNVRSAQYPYVIDYIASV